MEHREYIEQFLSAHVDDELDKAQLPMVEDHLAKCPGCTAMFLDEQRLKLLVRQRVGLSRAPTRLRSRILWAVAQEEPPAPKRSGFPRRIAFWSAIAASASLAFVIIGRALQTPSSIALFDNAIQWYTSAELHFTPNFPTHSVVTLVSDFQNLADFSPVSLDLSSSGLSLEGGRVDYLPGGGPLITSMYSGPIGTVLCARFRSTQELPQTDMTLDSLGSCYRYKGYSICALRWYDTATLFVSQMPLVNLMEAIETGAWVW